jgi:monovalent cation:proton antiporter-2 (CPA2) family protein
MEDVSLLLRAFVYLVTAVISVPIAKRLGLGSVLGYLIGGVIIGPFGASLVGDQTSVMHFAEFGVVMMLFLVGLELRPQFLWQLRKPILGLGSAQVIVTTAVFAAIGIALGFDWRIALAAAMILSLSSTAIILQTLTEKGLMQTPVGQSSFSVLLFQDIAVIPMLAFLPFLAQSAPAGGTDAANHGPAHAAWLATLPDWAYPLVVIGAVAFIVLAGRIALRPVFRAIAASRLREAFTALGLLLVIGIALLMETVGLSPALGTFLAGVVLADSEFRHELESDIEPFKGLLLGLFFISVGASIDFGLLAKDPLLIAGLVLALITVKIVALFGLSRLFRFAMAGQPAVCLRALARRRIRLRADRLRGAERRVPRFRGQSAGGRGCHFHADNAAADHPLRAAAGATLRAPGRGARARRHPGGRSCHHRRLRPVRPDLGPATPRARLQCHGARSQRGPGRATAPLRQQGLFRRCLARRPAAFGWGCPSESADHRDR